MTQPKPLAIGGNTGKLINSYYLEIEYLLDRIERSTNHYQTLGVERSASNQDVILAYHNAVASLHPSYYKVRATVTDEMLMRIDKAFGKVSQAFFVLTTPHKRSEYDQSLNRRNPVPLPINIPEPDQFTAPDSQPAEATDVDTAQTSVRPSGTIHIRTPQSHQPVFTKLSAEEEGVDRRRCQRFKLSIPALVAGHDRKAGKWQEMTKTIDVSWMGIGLNMRKYVRPGMVLHLVLPMPVKMRKHGHSEPAYSVYAIVRRVEPTEDGVRVVGLEFLGEHPPAGYLNKPWSTFRSQKWAGVDRRREPRVELAVGVEIECLDESNQVVKRAKTVTENVSAGGARISVKGVPATLDRVKIYCRKYNFEALASVRNRYIGKDGLVRLCLQFLDNKWQV
ncbi:MAG: PilZ domain-containing protein [Blastocatellia bacterium]|nr:PilZ domain-containing protein [Blastocatellia bacterium]